jgi:hypothetical protein
MTSTSARPLAGLGLERVDIDGEAWSAAGASVVTEDTVQAQRIT